MSARSFLAVSRRPATFYLAKKVENIGGSYLGDRTRGERARKFGEEPTVFCRRDLREPTVAKGLPSYRYLSFQSLELLGWTRR